MHETPLKRSVTAPDSSAPHLGDVPSIAVTANALGSFTPGGLCRHRTASPYPHCRLHSPDSPRQSDLLSHKDCSLGRSPAARKSETPSSVSSSGHLPLKVNNARQKAYASTDSSLKSSVLPASTAPSIVVSKVEGLQAVLPVDYHSNVSSQSYLSVYSQTDSPSTHRRKRSGSGGSGLSQLTLSDLNFTSSESSEKGARISHSIRRKFPGHVAAEVQRLSSSDPGARTPNLQFPILKASGAPDLAITLRDFERKLVIEDPDPSFHRSINSPVTDHPDEVVLEQVGSFGVHRLRNDSLGQLPHISTVGECSPASPQPSPTKGSRSLSSGLPSKKEAPSGLEMNPPQPAVAPPVPRVSEEMTHSTVVLPGEYGRRHHSRAGARSRGKNIGIPLYISTHPETQPAVVVGTLVTPEGPPATPESPFTSISREQTRLKGTVQNSPSPLITFLSVIKPRSGCRTRKPVAPGKENPGWILPAPPLGTTTALCFAHAYGSPLNTLQRDLGPNYGGRPRSLGSMIMGNESTLALSTVPSHVLSVRMHVPESRGSMITDIQAPISALPQHMRASDASLVSPSLQSVLRIIERDDRSLLSNQ